METHDYICTDMAATDVVAMTHARQGLMSMGNEWDRYTRLNDDKAQGVLREYNLMLINIRKGFIIAILSVRAMALTLFLHWHFSSKGYLTPNPNDRIGLKPDFEGVAKV